MNGPLLRSLFLSVLVFLALGFWGGAAAQSFRWLDVTQQVTLNADGTVYVRDERTLQTDEDFGEAFICLELAQGQQLTLLRGGTLSPGPTAEAFQQPCEEGSGQELVVRQAERVAERRVFFEYRLEGTMSAYRDVVEWYWQILERERPPVAGYTLIVRAPGPMDAPYDAFVHRFGNPETPTVRLSENRDELSVSFERVPDGDRVEVRYLMNPALFTLQGTEAGLERLLRDEARVAGLSAARRNPWWGALGLPIVVGLGVGIARGYRKERKRMALGPTMRYPFEPPADRPPAVAALLSSRLSTNTQAAFHATIMDLTRRGYGAFDSQGKEFNMRLVLDKDASKLLPFEKQVLEYLKRAAASGGRSNDPAYLDFSELKRYSEKNLARFLSVWAAELKGWLKGELGGPRLSRESQRAAGTWAGGAFLGAGLCVAGAVLTLGIAQAVLFLCALLCGALGVAAALLLPTWRAEVAAEAFGWQGFKRTLSDYSRMKDAPDDFFGLWDRYYCYAAALGVAERFLRNLARAAPLRNLDERSLAGHAGWMGHGVVNSGSFTGLSTAASSLGSALSAAGASASSGGSVAGGGGGGGGGSSGGR